MFNEENTFNQLAQHKNKIGLQKIANREVRAVKNKRSVPH